LLKGRALGEASAERCSAQKNRIATLPFPSAMNVERFRHPSVPQKLLPRTDATAPGSCQAVDVPLLPKPSWNVARASIAPAVAVAAESDGGGGCSVGPQALALTRGARPSGSSVASSAAPTPPPAGPASSARTATWSQDGPILSPCTEDSSTNKTRNDHQPSRQEQKSISRSRFCLVAGSDLTR